MTGKATSEASVSTPEETAPQPAKAPTTEPTGEVAASESTEQEQAPEPEKLQDPAAPTASAMPETAKPEPPSEGDREVGKGGDGRRVCREGLFHSPWLPSSSRCPQCPTAADLGGCEPQLIDCELGASGEAGEAGASRLRVGVMSRGR